MLKFRFGLTVSSLLLEHEEDRRSVCGICILFIDNDLHAFSGIYHPNFRVHIFPVYLMLVSLSPTETAPTRSFVEIFVFVPKLIFRGFKCIAFTVC